jgi:outer membrane protein
VEKAEKMKKVRTSFGSCGSWLTLGGLLGLVLLLWVVPARSETNSKVFTLEESLQRAFKESPQIRSAQEGIQAADFKKKQTYTGFFPKLGTLYSYNYQNQAPIITIPAQNNGSIPESTLTIGSLTNYAFFVTMDQPIFTGLALTRTYELAGLGLDISKIKLEEERLSLAFRLKESFLNILGAQKIRSVAEQTVLQIADHVRVARDFYNVGLIPLNDLLKSEVQLADARQNLVRDGRAVLLAQANFNTLLRIPLDQETEVQDILKYHSYSRDLEECQTEAAQKRPEIKEIETQIDIARKNVQLAKSEYSPQVSLQSRYIKQGDNPVASGSPFGVQSDNWDVTAVIKWNFWEWGRTHYLVQERIKQTEQVKESLTQIKDLVRLEVKEAYLSLREAEKNIGVAEKTIEQAEENFRINKIRYQEQVATSLEVLDAQTLLAQAKNNYYQALYAYNIFYSRLLRAMGTW